MKAVRELVPARVAVQISAAAGLTDLTRNQVKLSIICHSGHSSTSDQSVQNEPLRAFCSQMRLGRMYSPETVRRLLRSSGAQVCLGSQEGNQASSAIPPCPRSDTSSPDGDPCLHCLHCTLLVARIDKQPENSIGLPNAFQFVAVLE